MLEDQADDLKAAFAMTGRSIQPIVDIERTINSELVAIEKHVSLIVSEGTKNGLDVKQMALRHQGNKFFGQIMTLFRGKTVNWREWYLKNKLKEWALDVIPTSVQNEDVEATQE